MADSPRSLGVFCLILSTCFLLWYHAPSVQPSWRRRVFAVDMDRPVEGKPEDQAWTVSSQHSNIVLPTVDIDYSRVMMPQTEAAALVDILHTVRSRTNGRMTYLEYGSGGSTTEFTKFANIAVSIEHDTAWCELVRDRLRQANMWHVVQRCVAKENNTHGGSDGDNVSYRAYLDAVDGEGLPRTYDFVLIDGRARLGAAIKVLPFLRNDSVVVLHDAVRKRYDSVDLFYQVQQQNFSSASARLQKDGYKVLRRRSDIHEALPLTHDRIQQVYAQIPNIEA